MPRALSAQAPWKPQPPLLPPHLCSELSLSPDKTPLSTELGYITPSRLLWSLPDPVQGHALHWVLGLRRPFTWTSRSAFLFRTLAFLRS